MPPSRFRGMVVVMLKEHSIRFGCVLTIAFFAAAGGPVLAERLPHPCIEPPTRPIAELRPLAEAGESEAQYLLGLKYDVGDRFDNTWSEAASWFRRAAKQGHLAATTDLGIMNLQGRGVPKDAAEGLRLLRNAARKGNLCAQSILGRFLMMGNYVPQDLEEATKWYRMAAIRKFGSVHRNLAEIYSGRFGGEADFVEALRWAIISDNINYYDSNLKLIGKLRDKILPLMSTGEIAEAERRAHAWLARHGK